ncbi:MAG TPA: methyltransferase [Bacteroidia bacterium]|jgi:tRNA1Val (adenine37-N6)-methyltransferase|nr:methyltransferase [Bacteroidia bacterium]
MPSESFIFKKFTVFQHKCAHKVGTDAVLIGAWAHVEKAKSVLDIGTGTGIIALMMAQKSHAEIDAIDIEQSSYEQALENASHSAWHNRIKVHRTALQDFIKTHTRKYDVIISNPPYFVDSYKAPDEERNHARHNDTLPFLDLIEGVKHLLSPDGKFYTILPTKEALDFKTMAEKKGLFLVKRLRVKTKLLNDAEKRHLMQFSFKSGPLSDHTLSIEKGNHHDYTDEYKLLTGDFYLHF